jgi:hypothetical protein
VETELDRVVQHVLNQTFWSSGVQPIPGLDVASHFGRAGGTVRGLVAFYAKHGIDHAAECRESVRQQVQASLQHVSNLPDTLPKVLAHVMERILPPSLQPKA